MINMTDTYWHNLNSVKLRNSCIISRNKKWFKLIQKKIPFKTFLAYGRVLLRMILIKLNKW